MKKYLILSFKKNYLVITMFLVNKIIIIVELLYFFSMFYRIKEYIKIVNKIDRFNFSTITVNILHISVSEVTLRF